MKFVIITTYNSWYIYATNLNLTKSKFITFRPDGRIWKRSEKSFLTFPAFEYYEMKVEELTFIDKKNVNTIGSGTLDY